MAGVELIKVEDGEAGMRLDRWFKTRFPGLGFGHLQKLLRSGQIRVDGGRVKADSRVEPGQTVRVPPLGVDQKGSGPLTAKTIRGQDDGDVLAQMLWASVHGLVALRLTLPGFPWADAETLAGRLVDAELRGLAT